MRHKFVDALANGLARVLAAFVLFPVMLLLVWQLSGVFVWAEFPEPTWRQMIVMAGVAAVLATA